MASGWFSNFFCMASLLQRQSQPQFLRCQSVCTQPSAQLFQQPAQQKCQGLKQHERILQFDDFFENQRRFDRNQCAESLAPGQLLQANAFLP
jgi:hypothetical protein